MKGLTLRLMIGLGLAGVAWTLLQPWLKQEEKRAVTSRRKAASTRRQARKEKATLHQYRQAFTNSALKLRSSPDQRSRPDENAYAARCPAA